MVGGGIEVERWQKMGICVQKSDIKECHWSEYAERAADGNGLGTDRANAEMSDEMVFLFRYVTGHLASRFGLCLILTIIPFTNSRANHQPHSNSTNTPQKHLLHQQAHSLHPPFAILFDKHFSLLSKFENENKNENRIQSLINR